MVELISPWTAAALIASVVAFYASARGLQIGPGVEVIALTSVAANLVAIVGGILVFRDSIGSGAFEIAGAVARVLPRDRRGRTDPRPGSGYRHSGQAPQCGKRERYLAQPQRLARDMRLTGPRKRSLRPLRFTL